MSDVESPSAVYLAARREWNERYGNEISRAKQWRAVASMALVTTAISTGAAVWLSMQAHVVPYVIHVEKLGEAVAVHRLTVAPAVDAVRIKAQLARWIFDIRTVYSDRTAQVNLAADALGWVDRSSDALSQLDAWFQGNPPTERAKKATVGVSIESVSQLGADTWSVDWQETHRSNDGQAPTSSYWRATIRIKVDPPTTDDGILQNPNGVFVTWYSVTARVR